MSGINTSLREIGFNGVMAVGGNILENCKWELNYPEAAKTYERMSKNSTIAPALGNVEAMIARVPWTIEVPVGKEEEWEFEKNFLASVISDMDHSFGSFIRQVVSFNRFGFCVNEIVPRRRLKIEGSAYNDGYYGIRKLPIRSQDTIAGWEWKNNGRDLSAVFQQKVVPESYNKKPWRRILGSTTYKRYNDEVRIPKDRFLLFRNQTHKDSPVGVSPLDSCWESWKYLTALQQVEAQGISQDMRGIKKLLMPSEYLSDEADADQKETAKEFKRGVSAVHNGDQVAVVMPSDRDIDGNLMFDFDMVSVSGRQGYDVGSVIKRYQVDILTCLMANFLSLGNTGGGSYALSGNLMKVSEIAIEAKLIEIQDVLNDQLVTYLWKINGFDLAKKPTFKFGKIDRNDLDVLSKAIHRLNSAGLILKTPDNINFIQETLGMPSKLGKETSLEEILKWTSGASPAQETREETEDEENSISNNENS